MRRALHVVRRWDQSADIRALCTARWRALKTELEQAEQPKEAADVSSTTYLPPLLCTPVDEKDIGDTIREAAGSSSALGPVRAGRLIHQADCEDMYVEAPDPSASKSTAAMPHKCCWERHPGMCRHVHGDVCELVLNAVATMAKLATFGKGLLPQLQTRWFNRRSSKHRAWQCVL